jgi:hypothetical protein
VPKILLLLLFEKCISFSYRNSVFLIFFNKIGSPKRLSAIMNEDHHPMGAHFLVDDIIRLFFLGLAVVVGLLSCLLLRASSVFALLDFSLSLSLSLARAHTICVSRIHFPAVLDGGRRQAFDAGGDSKLWNFKNPATEAAAAARELADSAVAAHALGASLRQQEGRALAARMERFAPAHEDVCFCGRLCEFW